MIIQKNINRVSQSDSWTKQKPSEYDLEMPQDNIIARL